MSFIITFIAGISTVIGGIIPFFNIKNKERIIIISLAFASGIMIAISMFDLLPEAFNYLKDSYNFFVNGFIIIFSFIGGVVLFKFIDKYLTGDVDNLYRLGIFSMIAIILHNVPEGIITFILSTNDIKLGIVMAISIALHNIPEGISIMVPIYYGSGGSLKKAFFMTLLAGLSEPIGGVVFYILFKNYINNLMIGILFSVISGIMIYLSFTELLPKSLEYNKRNLTLSFFMIGIIFFLGVSILFIH